MIRKKRRPQCRQCGHYAVSRHEIWRTCLHPMAANRQITFDHEQQRRPDWCPLIDRKEASE